MLLHVYFLDLVPEIFDQLRHIPVAYDLIVTNSSGFRVPVEGDLGLLRNHRVLDIPNRGRDIWPTLAAVNCGILDPYLLILKIHTKQSAWRAAHAELSGDGELWRQGLIDELLGRRENVVEILNAFREDPCLGVVTADGSVLGPEFWGDNQRNTAELARRLEMDVDEDALEFPAGSVYWCRGLVLQGLRSAGLIEADFEDEAGQVNGTTAHAVERLVGLVTRGGRAARRRAIGRAAPRTPRPAGRDWTAGRSRPGPGTSRSTSRSSTRSRRTTAGGGRASPSGPTWSRPSRSTTGTTSRGCRPTSGSTTCGWTRPGPRRPISPRGPGSRASCTTTTGSPAAG